MPGALVILSGGQDSTTCLFWAVQKWKINKVRALFFDYGQRHLHREWEACKIVASMAAVCVRKITLQSGILLSTSPLVDKSFEVAQYESAEKLPGGIEDTFVPCRNALFLVLAANRAVAWGLNKLVIGVSEEDYGGYPDCRTAFIASMQQTLNAGIFGTLGDRLKIITPLAERTKSETVKLAISLSGCMDALAYSHTCYKGFSPPCGYCHACLLRQKGFEEAEVKDPLLIRTQGGNDVSTEPST